MSITRLDNCQYLLVSHLNYTLTNFAAHKEGLSHDSINRYLATAKLTPRLVWENVREQIVTSDNGYVLFDDTVLDKRHAHAIELVRRQWSGNAHQVIKGIGVVTCVYVNPETGQFWLLDYRIYDPAGDGKSKPDHVREMLLHTVHTKELPFSTVLMDSWYASQEMMLLVESLHKVYYCPLKANRQVDDSGGASSYQRVDALTWHEHELRQGKRVKLKGFPKDYKVQLFRVTVSTHRTDFVVTNDVTQDTTEAVRQVCGFRFQQQVHKANRAITA